MTVYLVDTNVISELVGPIPDANVVTWVRAADESQLFLSVLSFGEIRRGIEQIPPVRAAKGCGAGWRSISRIGSTVGCSGSIAGLPKFGELS